MGQGLGKNSPVVLSFGRENYEALLDRHGQFIRWRQAQRCTCIKKNTFQPDVHCKKCGGRGFVYDVQKDCIIQQTILIKDTSGILEVSPEYEDCTLVSVYDRDGRGYQAEKNGIYVILNNESSFIRKGNYLTVVMNQRIIKELKEADTESIGSGYYRINGLRVRRSGIDGINYTSPCDILSIGKIIDAEGNVFQVKELRQDTFYIESKKTIEIDETGNIDEIFINPVNPVKVENVEYIAPFVFALLNQNINKADAQAMVDVNGDAVVTFPYRFNVAENDVLTALSGSYIRKEVLNRIANDYDTLGAYFVDKVIKLDSKAREFKQDVDFILVGSNRIKWLCEDAPEAGETYSISYSVFPTYLIVKEIPQLRTSEDQHMPKKAVVKLFNTYAEMSNINRQVY